eukprot:scaffold302667_cov35-Tisochrysis_lutea.AAC.2
MAHGAWGAGWTFIEPRTVWRFAEWLWSRQGASGQKYNALSRSPFWPLGCEERSSCTRCAMHNARHRYPRSQEDAS